MSGFTSTCTRTTLGTGRFARMSDRLLWYVVIVFFLAIIFL
ncbi:hypothetical protein FDI38_gp050 [Streptomyces phage Peebs]|uniref:Uncharacterized protein n=1 Tax=Streptomyces phage Peebs TaxID=2023994 RepID=A0A222Z292_9CAUD|nr:hypothetical protein FDI38_gp010 [Streptomyces phage Peebs]YP_009611426.1 hypothetical protein FDI38_gp050 [Streptomyces phage Peebs]ASR77717.1 hypothetical protein SEA_PEEBS_10 [Streptomyces phage Peebs]ASR77916.1 hypothetical protein SEA_PEEBS_257 [Streptomyces phage Peebs]